MSDLFQTSEDLRSFLANAADGAAAYAADPDFTALWASDSLAELLGFSGQPAERFLTRERIHPNDLLWVARVVRPAAEARCPFSVEFRLLRADNRPLRVKVRGVPTGELYQNRWPVFCQLYTVLPQGELVPESAVEQYRQIQEVYDDQPCPLLWLSPGNDPEIRYVNLAGIRLLGYPDRDRFLRTASFRLADYLPPEDLAEAVSALSSLTQAEDQVLFSCRIRDAAGTTRWMSAVAQMRRALSGKLLIHCIFSDITRQKLAELDTLRRYQTEVDFLSATQSEALMGKLWANISRDKLLDVAESRDLSPLEPSGSYTEVVRRTAALCASGEMAGQLTRAFSPAALQALFASGQTSRTMEYRRRTANGSIRWVRTYAKLYRDVESGDTMGFVYTYDIDQERTSAAIINRLVDMEFGFLGLLNVKDRKLTCYRNGQLEAQLQVDHVIDYEEELERFVLRFIIDEQREAARRAFRLSAIRRGLRTDDSYNLSFSVLENGQIRRKRWRMAYLDDTHTTILFTRSDITGLFRVQERQKQVLQTALDRAEQASAAKSEFLSRMSHEIRTPMNAIIGMNALAAQSLRDPAQAAACIAKVDNSARYLLSLINDILDMSRIESGKLALKEGDIYLSRFLRDIDTICQEQAAERKVDYRSELPLLPDGPYRGDGMKLRQVLINLVANAIKFTPPGGSVRLSVRQEPSRGAVPWMRFTVTDTGIGISPEFQRRMFRPFEQADTGTTSAYGGTGLGLAISKNLVELMGGRITAESAPGKGSRFTVRVPLPLPEPPAPDAAVHLLPPSSLPDLAGRRCLLAEDHPLNAEIARRLLEARGMAVDTAANGREALDAFSRSPTGFYDLVLMDIRMPVMDGLAAARAIRRLERPDAASVPILAMSANAFEEDRETSRAAGMNAHLAKPVEPAELYDTIGAFMK